jgi:GAF domain-containing protein
MLDRVAQQLQSCDDLQSLLDLLLSRSLGVTGTVLGNVQLMDWNTGCLTIAAQRGFNDDFLNFFRTVRAEQGSACGRAIRRRSAVVVEDVLRDQEFKPYRTIALKAGFRAVQSTPLISSSGAFLGVLSTHFPARHRPCDHEMRELRMTGELLANETIRRRSLPRVSDGQGTVQADKERIARSLEAVTRSYDLLRRVQ